MAQSLLLALGIERTVLKGVSSFSGALRGTVTLDCALGVLFSLGAAPACRETLEGTLFRTWV